MHFSSLKPSVQPSARKAITRPIGSEVKLNSSAGHKLTISRIWQVMTAEGRRTVHNLKDPKRDILCILKYSFLYFFYFPYCLSPWLLFQIPKDILVQDMPILTSKGLVSKLRVNSSSLQAGCE